MGARAGEAVMSEPKSETRTSQCRVAWSFFWVSKGKETGLGFWAQDQRKARARMETSVRNFRMMVLLGMA
jgi:hypothetical protein